MRLRPPAHSLKQHRLSDAGLATDHNCSAAVAKTVYQRVQDCALPLALDQLAVGVDQGHAAHRASMSVTGSSAQLDRRRGDSLPIDLIVLRPQRAWRRARVTPLLTSLPTDRSIRQTRAGRRRPPFAANRARPPPGPGP